MNISSTYNFDYYPFGSSMPGRTFSTPSYKYGFNGMLKEDDITAMEGKGNHLDFGSRIYDSRLGRFLSVDPLFHSSPGNSPYTFAGNSPIAFIDKDGEFAELFIEHYLSQALAEIMIEQPNASDISLLSQAMTVAMGRFLQDFTEYTDIEDGVILGTMITRDLFGMENGKAINVHGLEASTLDKSFAVVGVIFPIVSCALLKKISKKGSKLFIKKFMSNASKLKIAQFIADKGFDSKLAKEMTGKWAIKANPQSPSGSKLTADLANFIDETLGDVVKGLDVDINVNVKGLAGDIDIMLENVSIQVESTVTKSQKILDSGDYKDAMKNGKKYILYVDKKISNVARISLEKSNVVIVTTKDELIKAIK